MGLRECGCGEVGLWSSAVGQNRGCSLQGVCYALCLHVLCKTSCSQEEVGFSEAAVLEFVISSLPRAGIGGVSTTLALEEVAYIQH